MRRTAQIAPVEFRSGESLPENGDRALECGSKWQLMKAGRSANAGVSD